jgi:hypothetical protein
MEKGEEMRLLFGANDMQIWNINLDPKIKTLDLLRFKKEFEEFIEYSGG